MKYHGRIVLSCKQIPLIFLLFASPMIADESALMTEGTVNESITPQYLDEPVAVSEYIKVYKNGAAEYSGKDWWRFLQSIAPLSDNEYDAAVAVIDSLRKEYVVVPDSANCERWPAWQLGLCNLELAAGRYSAAVDRHFNLFKEPTSCIDDQQMWWFLVERHYYQLVLRKQYSEVAELLESVRETFSAGPGRQMHAQLARLKYRLGTLTWEKEIEGTLGEARYGGIASHYRDLITPAGDTLDYLITSSTGFICNDDIWVPWAGFTPRQDFESEFSGGDPISVSYPIDTGKSVVFCLGVDDEVIMIELSSNSLLE